MIIGVVFLINLDTKSQKGDSRSAAAANLLSDTLSSSLAKESVISSNFGAEKKDSREVNNVGELIRDASSCDRIMENKNGKRKKKKRQQPIEPYNWRHLNAFQQWQQKKFTYSVSYFNWAVSDEEEEEDDEGESHKSPFSPYPYPPSLSPLSKKTGYLSSERVFVGYQGKNKQRIQNKQESMVEKEISELSVISSGAMGIVLTEEFIDITLPFKRLAINKHRTLKK